jgi:hypothetical protein
VLPSRQEDREQHAGEQERPDGQERKEEKRRSVAAEPTHSSLGYGK